MTILARQRKASGWTRLAMLAAACRAAERVAQLHKEVTQAFAYGPDPVTFLLIETREQFLFIFPIRPFS